VGKIKRVTDPTGVYGFAYDDMGRLIGTTTQYTFAPGTFTNSYAYGAESYRASLTAPDGSIRLSRGGILSPRTVDFPASSHRGFVRARKHAVLLFPQLVGDESSFDGKKIESADNVVNSAFPRTTGWASCGSS
jgi:YD repeat-containing protein